MKIKYLIGFFLIICVVLFFFFSKKEKKISNTTKRNIAGQLAVAKSITIPKGFSLRSNDAGFIALTEGDPYFVSLDIDTVKHKGIGPAYFFEMRNDTSFFTKAGGAKFYKAFAGDTSIYPLSSNEGYIAYDNNEVYYAYRGSGVTKELEQVIILCRKNLATGITDTLLNMNEYVRKNYPDVQPDEYVHINGGRFCKLNGNRVAYMPYGINKVFLLDGTDTSSFTPLNNRQVIRWKRVHSNVPGMGEVITFATATGEAEELNDAILYWKGKYIVINSAVFNAGNADYCYLDIYNADTLAYEKSLSIQVNDKDNDFFLSFAVSNGYLAALSAKGTLSTYKLPL